MTVYERTYNTDTMKRMLDFMYYGEYDVHADNTATKMDVLSHLFCYAIGESYVAKGLSDYALARFDEALHAIKPKDFAELVGVIASHTEALPVHRSLRNVAFYRLDELAESKSFVNVIGGKHLTVEQQDGDSDLVHRNLQAAIQLATFSANMFRVANQTKSRAAWENARLSKRLEETLEIVEVFRKQVIKSSASLHNSEGVHGNATQVIQAAQKEAQEAKKELFKISGQSYLMFQDLQSTKLKLEEVEGQAASTAQALAKAELELDILQNEDRNDRQALEKLSESLAAADTSLKQREQQLAASLSRDQARVENLISTANGQQRKACHVQNEAKAAQDKAVQEQERYTKLQSKLQWESEQVKRLLDEANQEVQRLMAENKTIREQDKEKSAVTLNQAVQEQERYTRLQSQLQGESEQAKRPLDEANREVRRLMAENAFLEADHAAPLDQAVEQQREFAMLQIQDELSQVKRELAEATKVTQRVLAENQVLRKQAKEDSVTSSDQSIQQQRELAVLQIQDELSQAKRELAQVSQETQRLMAGTKALHNQGKENSAIVLNQAPSEHLSLQEKTLHAQQVYALQLELNRANLRNFTLQRTMDDLHTMILNGAGGGQAAPGF